MSSKIQFDNITTFSSMPFRGTFGFQQAPDIYDYTTLIVGDLTVNTSMCNDIDIPQSAPFETSHIILQKGDDEIFKSCIKSAPVRPFEFTILDQCGHLINNYPKTRTTNCSGTLPITTEPKTLINNITIPLFEESQGYLILSTYDGLESCILPSSKALLVKKDLEDLQSKTDTTKVVLFITDKLFTNISNLGINLQCSFKDVFYSPDNHIIPYFVEYLLGKTVQSSKPSFQGLLKFKTDTKEPYVYYGPECKTHIMAVQCVTDTPNKPIECHIRRHGKLQINTSSTVNKCKIIIVLGHKSRSIFGRPTLSGPDLSQSILISEKSTRFNIKIGLKNASTLTDLTTAHLTALTNAAEFYENINKNHITFATPAPTEDVKLYILKNADKVTKYMFDSPLETFRDIKTLDNQIKHIIDYGLTLQDDIFNVLYTTAHRLNYNKTTTKTSNAAMVARAFSSVV